MLRILNAWTTRGIHINERLAKALLGAFALARERQDQLTALTAQDWGALAFSVSNYGKPKAADGGMQRLTPHDIGHNMAEGESYRQVPSRRTGATHWLVQLWPLRPQGDRDVGRLGGD